MEEDNSSSSSSSDSEEELQDDELTEKIKELETKVTASPYEYNLHVELIEVLQKAGELEGLRKARTNMSEIYPLTEALWMSWLKDEIKLAVTLEELEHVSQLFERAVKDYISVEIWLEFCQFSIGCMAREGGIEHARSVFERATTAVGTHVAKGAIIWEAYREFENALLSAMQPAPGAVVTAVQTEQINEQTNKITKLFKRQLSVPLLEMDKTWEEFESWIDGTPDTHFTQVYKAALSKLQKVEPIENELLSAAPPRLDLYQRYIQHELKNGYPPNIQCIFERTLVDNCLNPDIWKQYTNYLDTNLKDHTVVLPVFERAIRNSPWDVELWQNYLRAMERYKKSHQEINSVMEKALLCFSQGSDVKELWMTFLEYLRRRIHLTPELKDDNKELEDLRLAFDKANSHIIGTYGLEADPDCSILQYWARIEAKLCKNMEKTREIWNDIMQLRHDREVNGKMAQYWLEYANLEKLCGNGKHLRKLFQKGLQATADYPESVAKAWLAYERDEGDLAQMEFALEKIKVRLQQIQEKKEKEEIKAQEIQEQKAQKRKDGKKARTEDKRARRREEKNMSGPAGTEGEIIRRPFGNDGRQPGQKATYTGKRKAIDDESEMEVDSDGFRIPSAITQAPTKKAKVEESTEQRAIERDISKDERSVFVSNLSYDSTEEILHHTFSQIGEVVEIRLVKDYKGRSKGFCYVEFTTKQAAMEALKRDREPMEGRPMFISKCEDRKRQDKPQLSFRYQMNLEKNKLFVKGLPLTATKDQVTELFQGYGQLKEVRIVTYRNGHSKGLAYIEYKDEVAAATALLKTDGMKVEDHVISVALSNPPPRGQPQSGNSGLGHGSNVPSLGGRPRDSSNLSLVPRSVQRSRITPTSSTNGNKDINDGPDQSKPGTSAMSNEQFRNMFLKK